MRPSFSRSNSRKEKEKDKEKKTPMQHLNRALSIRSNKKEGSSGSGTGHRFNLSSLRGTVQPELSKKLYKLIKSENHLINHYEAAGKERISIASQLSDWGEATNDDAVSEISDKIGVLLSELGEQEDLYAHNLDDSRAILKAIRNTEKSVQPSRDHKAKIADEISKLKAKEPQSAKLVILEQELVRAEAENLVAEAQLTNITRQKLKEAYAAEFAATIERAEKQIILARHARRILNLLDDTPVVPGNIRPSFEHTSQVRQILNDAEDDLHEWQPELEDVSSNSHGLGNNAVPSEREPSTPVTPHHTAPESNTTEARTVQGDHLASHNHPEEPTSRISSGTSVTTGTGPSYAPSEAGTSQIVS